MVNLRIKLFIFIALTEVSPNKVIPFFKFRELPMSPPAFIIYSFPSIRYLLCFIISFNFFLELIIVSEIISFGTLGGFIDI
jgi:hypothetical protein